MLLLLACTADPTDSAPKDSAPVDPGDTAPPAVDYSQPWDDALFPPDRVMEVVITLDEADWDTLRNQSRNIFDMLAGDCLAEPWEAPYDYFHASVEMDGELWPDVGVRKKGLMGSQSTTKPGLKIKFDEFEDGAEFRGREKVTLNNTPQDVTMLRSCLAYTVFRAGGVPAPHCSFTHVTVNGDDLGVYANVETVDETMIERIYGDHDGELFEGTLSDFQSGWTGTFDEEFKNSEQGDLDPVVQALMVDDDALVDAVKGVVDTDEWLTYWSLEVLTGHWDSYDSNRNNFYVYLDPQDGKVDFLPWGPDATFDSDTPFGQGYDQWIVANSYLSWRWASTPEGLELYRSALQDTAARAWDADALIEEGERMRDLIKPYMTDVDGWAGQVRTLFNVIDNRLEVVSAGWDETPSLAQPASQSCLTEVGTVSGSFSTTWDSYATKDTFTWGDADITLVIDGVDYPTSAGAAVAGDLGGGYAGILPSTTLDDGTLVVPYFQLETTQITPGDVALDWAPAVGALYTLAPGASEFAMAAYLDGTLHLDEASTTSEEPVSGSFTCGIWGFGA